MNNTSKQAAIDLLQQSHKDFDIVYGGSNYLANHMAHGIVALEQMNASEERLKEWYKIYAKHDVMGHHLDPAKSPSGNFIIDSSNWKDFLGKKEHYPELFEFFKMEIKTQGTDAVLNQYLPILCKGLAGSALHPIIHTGFALDIPESTTMLSEGLAYLVFAHLPMVECDVHSLAHDKSSGELCKTDRTLKDIVGMTYDNVALWNLMRQEDTKNAGFQPRMKKLAARSDLLQYAIQWKTLYERPSNPDEQRRVFEAACKEIAEAATFVFLHTQPPASDFFLLHGVTACYAVLNLAHRLTSHTDRMQLLFEFVYALLATYVVEGMPNVVAHSQNFSPPPFSSWKDLFEELVKPGSSHNDVHVLKVIFVCNRFEEMFGKNPLWIHAAGCCVQAVYDESEDNFEMRIGLKEDPKRRED